MIDSLPPSLRRALALSILLALLLLGWSVVVRPLVGVVTERRSDIVSLTQRLGRLRTAIARIPEIRKREAADKQRLESAGGIWTGSSEAATAAIIQDRLRQAVDASGGAVKSASHLQGAAQKDLLTVRVRFSIDGTIDTIQQTLAAIEAARPALFVDSMTVMAPATMTREKPPLLGLDIEVVGFMRKTSE